MKKHLVLAGVVCSFAVVATAGDLPELESTMAFTLSESRFVVENVPVTATRKEAVDFVTAALDEQFAELRKDFLGKVESALEQGETERAQYARCHVQYDVNGNVTFCGGNPYDCLCVWVFAPPA